MKKSPALYPVALLSIALMWGVAVPALAPRFIPEIPTAFAAFVVSLGIVCWLECRNWKEDKEKGEPQ